MAIRGRLCPVRPELRSAPREPNEFSTGSIRIAPLPLAYAAAADNIECYVEMSQGVEILAIQPELAGPSETGCPPPGVCGPLSDISVDDAPTTDIRCEEGGVRFKKMTRGDTVKMSGQVKLGTAEYSLVGHSMWFTGKLSKSDPDASAVFQRTLGNGITFTDAARGKYSIELVPSNTSSLPALKRLVYWDAQIKSPEGRIYTVDHDEAVVSPDITLAS